MLVYLLSDSKKLYIIRKRVVKAFKYGVTNVRQPVGFLTVVDCIEDRYT